MCLRVRVTAWDAAKANKSEIVGLNSGIVLSTRLATIIGDLRPLLYESTVLIHSRAMSTLLVYSMY